MSVVSATSELKFRDPLESLLSAIEALPAAEQWRLVEKTLKNLKKMPAAPKARKSKKTDASSEEGEPRPKKEPNVWIKHVGFVRSVMNVLGEKDTDAKKAKAVTQVAKALKDSGAYFTSQGEAEAAIEQITEAFQAWKADPPAAAPKESPKEKKPKAAAVDSDSEEGEAVVEKKPKRTLSPEAAASKKAKTAETKARNKAAKEAASAAASVASAASAAVASAAEADSDAEEGEVAVVRSYDLGKGEMPYDTYPGEKSGTEYLYEHASGKFVGLYNPASKKLKTDVKDPAA